MIFYAVNLHRSMFMYVMKQSFYRSSEKWLLIKQGQEKTQGRARPPKRETALLWTLLPFGLHTFDRYKSAVTCIAQDF